MANISEAVTNGADCVCIANTLARVKKTCYINSFNVIHAVLLLGLRAPDTSCKLIIMLRCLSLA